MKKLCTQCTSITIVFAIILSFCTPAYALGLSSETQSTALRAVELTSVIEKSLSYEFGDANVGNVENWIQLYDPELIPFAMFVPLCDDDGEVIGYTVVSDIAGVNTALITSEGQSAAAYAKLILETYKNRKTDDILVYAFPHAFFIGNTDSFAKINLIGNTFSSADISEYKSNTVELLKTRSGSAESNSTRATFIYGSLDHWDNNEFVPVSDAGTIHYGGYQGWLTDEGVSSFWANRSCGVTASANMFYYMSKYVDGKQNLYTRDGITRADFSAFQKEIYDYCMSPSVIGIPSLANMASKVEEWAEYRNVSLSRVTAPSEWNELNVKTYIINGLWDERPVLLLTWNSPIEDLEVHWVTVTRVYSESGSTLKFVTSNWADKTEYDFATWCNGSSLYKGVLYFE